MRWLNAYDWQLPEGNFDPNHPVQTAPANSRTTVSNGERLIHFVAPVVVEGIPVRRARLRTSEQQADRKGLALVEFAIFLPIVAALVFGAIETANMIYLRQGLTMTAYEVARSVSSHGGVQADAVARGQQVLAARRITGASITVTPTIDSTTPPGTLVTVTVTASADANAISPQWFFQGFTLSKSVVFSRM
ncbi:MAG: TadE/TadG family type IV pilus assembly protein [Planctomycetaceae bacterium]